MVSTQRFRSRLSRPSTWTAPSNFTYPRSPRSHARYTTDFGICSSAQMSATVSRRSSAITAIDAGGERSERVSPASVNGLHSVASAGTTASREGRGDARDFVGLTRVASTCTSSSGPWQGDAPPSFATLPVLAVSPSRPRRAFGRVCSFGPMPSPECLQDCGGIGGARAEPCGHRSSSQHTAPSSESTNWRASSPC